MGMIDLGKLDKGGVNQDIPPYRLAPNVFNDVLDVDFENGGMVPAVKEIGAFVNIAGNPVHLEEVEGPSGSYNFVYFLTNRCYVWNAGLFFDITNVDGMGESTPVYRWNGGFYHGWWVWTNGRGIPQQWNPQDPLSPLVNLENWPENIAVRFIRPYLNFLVGFSYTSSDLGFSQQTVFWSDQADPGTLPSWDLNDPTKKAGVFSLTADSDGIEGAAELRGEMFIYKRSSVWVMRYVGGTFVMQFAPRFSERGLLNPRCVIALEGAHFCIDRIGFYFHNGVSITPVGEGVIWETFSNDLFQDPPSGVFIEFEEAKNRIWIFYSTIQQEVANRVLIHDLKNGTWTFRQVQQAECAVRGAMQSIGANSPWDGYTNYWSEDVYEWESDFSVWSDFVSWDGLPPTRLWNDLPTGGVQRSIHYASRIDTASTVFDESTGMSTSGDVSWAGSSQYPPIWYIGKEGERLPGYFQRLGFCVLEQDSSGASFVDQTVYKHLTELYLELDSGPLEVRVGTQVSSMSTPDWGAWVVFDPLVDIKLDPHCVGKYLALEFRGISTLPYRWKLSGVSLNVQNGGRY